MTPRKPRKMPKNQRAYPKGKPRLVDVQSRKRLALSRKAPPHYRHPPNAFVQLRRWHIRNHRCGQCRRHCASGEHFVIPLHPWKTNMSDDTMYYLIAQGWLMTCFISTGHMSQVGAILMSTAFQWARHPQAHPARSDMPKKQRPASIPTFQSGPQDRPLSEPSTRLAATACQGQTASVST